MKIGYVSVQNPYTDRKAWSGLVYKIREAIEYAGFDVEWIKISPPKHMLLIVKMLLKIRYGFTQNHPLIYKIMAKYTDWECAKECDILFFSGGAQIMKYSPIKKDYIYYTDACFNQMVDYYWHNLNKKYIELANREELYTIQHAAINIRASNWAKDCAVNFYNGNPATNFVLEFGANLDPKDICESQEYREGQLNILFSGVDWNRKGGNIAVETVSKLREKYKINAHLYIVGIRELPEEIEKLDYIINCGFLNKNIHGEYGKYIDILKKSHVFLLPTKAECAGVVFSEASAYGLPIWTHDTGGIGDYVINGINGYRLRLGSSADDFADEIYESIDSEELSTLHDGALKLYLEKLNWEVWGDRFKDIVINNFGNILHQETSQNG